MGFPVGYAEVFFPNLLLHTLTFLGLLRNLVFHLFHFLGLSEFLETDTIWPHHNGETPLTPGPTKPPSVSASLIRDLLPETKYGEEAGVEEGCSCAVCLLEFSSEDEIRCLRNCRHIFHRNCVDRWIDLDQKSCPLCRRAFVPDEMMEDYNQRLWEASGVTELYSYADYTSSF